MYVLVLRIRKVEMIKTCYFDVICSQITDTDTPNDNIR